MTPEILAATIASIRSDGTDTAQVEVKRASGGVPSNLPTTLSAFANTEGGVVLLGIDESNGFTTVGVTNPGDMQRAVANMAHSMNPPLRRIATQVMLFEGKNIVVVEVGALEPELRPSRVSGGQSYVRVNDGDYPLTAQEETTFEHNRGRPRFDEEPIEGATRSDLDEELVRSYLQLARERPELSRMGDDELLMRTGVITADGQPTVAGLLSLGVYPQQFFPRLIIKASVAPDRGDPTGTRASDVQEIAGAIPAMLDEAMRWVTRNTRTRVVFGGDGQGRDVPEYPLEAVRELLSNALVHRDLAPHTLNAAVDLRLLPDRLIIENPGGLWNLNQQALGLHMLSSSRNGQLIRMLQWVRTRQNIRVVEALATGINRVFDSLADAGLQKPRFFNEVIRFKVMVLRAVPIKRKDADWLSQLPNAARLSDDQRRVLVRMRRGEKWTTSALQGFLRLDAHKARQLLTGLVDMGLARTVGATRGRMYELVAGLDGDGAVADVAAELPQLMKRARMAPDDAAATIYGLLSPNSPVRTGELAAQLDWPLPRVRNALRTLVEEGKARSVGGGRSTGYLRS